jgi:hypothetical protein
MLRIERVRVHKVLQGQTIKEIAAAYCVGEWALAQENALIEEVKEGQVLLIPVLQGNRYTAQVGDEKQLLCGSKENYEKKNGPYLYPGKRVVL